MACYEASFELIYSQQSWLSKFGFNEVDWRQLKAFRSPLQGGMIFATAVKSQWKNWQKVVSLFQREIRPECESLIIHDHKL